MGETLDYLENAFPDEPEQWGGDSSDVFGDSPACTSLYHDEEDCSHLPYPERCDYCKASIHGE